MRSAQEQAVAHAALTTALGMTGKEHRGRETRRELLRAAWEFTKPPAHAGWRLRFWFVAHTWLVAAVALPVWWVGWHVLDWVWSQR